MQDYKFYFKKNYGQNFLKNKDIVCRMVKSANILPHSLVIEIGPGAGILTQELAKVADQVLSYEIDERLEDILDQNLLPYSNVDILYRDFLKSDVASDIQKYTYQHLYVVANLPYYITTPIIQKIIEEKLNVSSITVMVQKEVGDRFCATPKNREYSSLTVFLNYYFDVKKLFFVSRNNFVPVPHVDSVVVSFLRKKPERKLHDEIFFQTFLHDCFRYKRKTLRNNLRNYPLDKVESLLLQHGFSLSSRAEELPLDMFVLLSNMLS